MLSHYTVVLLLTFINLMKYCNYELAPRVDVVHLSTGLPLIILLTI